MNIGLLYVNSAKKGATNKDAAGSFGSVTNIGNSIFATMIQNAKKSGDKIPLLSYAIYASIFKQNKHNVKYFEDELPIGQDLVIIHGSLIDHKNEVDYAKKIKEHPENRRTKICFVGPFVRYYKDYFLSHGDIVVNGEAEEYFMSIRNGDLKLGIINTNNITDLDSIPPADWSIFDISAYSYRPLITKKPFLTITTSRGCSFSCSYYCPYTSFNNTKYRVRSVDNVINEIKAMKKDYGIKGLMFRDPLFGVKQDYVRSLCNGIKNLEINWGCETRLDLLNEEKLKIMKDAGLRSINVGIESYSDDILKNFKRKPINIIHQENILKICDKQNIKIAAFFILGMPKDTKESIKKTIKYAKKLNTYVAQFSIAIPYPGTPYYENIYDKITTDDFEEYTASKLITPHENLTPNQLSGLREYAFVSYYFRIRYLLKYIKYIFI